MTLDEYFRSPCSASQENTLHTNPKHHLKQELPELSPRHCRTTSWEEYLKRDLATAVASDGGALHLLKLAFKLLDGSMSSLQILVQTIPLADQLLLPGSESLFLHFDLFGESLSKGLFLFFELGVVKLSRSRLAEFPCLHLLTAVDFVVVLFGGVNEIKHVGPDED